MRNRSNSISKQFLFRENGGCTMVGGSRGLAEIGDSLILFAIPTVPRKKSFKLF